VPQRLLDSPIVRDSAAAVDFITNVLQDFARLAERHVLRRVRDLGAGATDGLRRLVAVDPALILIPEDDRAVQFVANDRVLRGGLEVAVKSGKWEGTLERVCNNGERFTPPTWAPLPVLARIEACLRDDQRV